MSVASSEHLVRWSFESGKGIQDVEDCSVVRKCSCELTRAGA